MAVDLESLKSLRTALHTAANDIKGNNNSVAGLNIVHNMLRLAAHLELFIWAEDNEKHSSPHTKTKNGGE